MGRWILRLVGYHMIIEHRTRDKHQNADSLSKKTEFYERFEGKQASQAEIKDGFSFLNKDIYDKLLLSRWLDMSGHPIPGHPVLPVETAAEIKNLAKGNHVPLGLLVRSNLVQQDLFRLGINSIALLKKTVNVAPDVMRKLRDLLEREVERHDHEWMETMQRLIITERTEKIPVAIRRRDFELDCRSIVNRLVKSIPKDVFLRTSYVERQQATGTQTAQEVSVKLRSSVARRVQFTDARRSTSRARTVYPEMKHCPGSQVMSGLVRIICPGSQVMSRLTRVYCPGSPCRETSRKKTDGGDADSISSSDWSESQSCENVSETTSNSDVSEIAVHSFLVEWKRRGLDRKKHQDPDRDRHTSIVESKVVDNAATELELIAVSKLPTRLLPHATVVRTNLEPLEQDATPLKNI